MKRPAVLQLVVLGCLLAGSAAATSITVASGSVTGTLVVDLNTLLPLAFDVRSTAVLAVSNPGPLGAVALTDNGNPIPNNSLLAFNSAFTESGLLTFSGLTGVFVGADQYLVSSIGTPAGVVTDPALAAVLLPLVFDFQIVSGTLINATTLGFTLNLSQIAAVGAVPEPSTLVITFGALLAGSLWRVRRKAR